MMDSSARERSAVLLAALAHPTRIAIVELLASQDLSVGEVANRLSLGQSSASQHLAVLQRAGIVKATPLGTSRMYRLRGPRIIRVLELVEEFCAVHEIRGLPLED